MVQLENILLTFWPMSEKSPSVDILFQSIKDLSVENPSPRKLFEVDQGKLETRIEVDVQANSIGQDQYEVVLLLRLSILEQEETLYMIELQFAALTKITDASEEILPLLLYVQCPYLIFPYVRLLVTVLTQESGLPPLTLHPIDFGSLFAQRMQQMQEKA